MGIRGKLFVCAAVVAMTASGSLGAAAASRAAGPVPGTARPLGLPSFTGIYLSTWGTAHVAFGDAFKAWLAQAGTSVSADAPVTLDADAGGFTMPVSATAGDHLDAQGRMLYPGGLTVTVTAAGGAPGKQLTLRFGPFYVRVMPQLAWTAGLSVDGKAAAGELVLASGDYAEALAGGGSPSPTGFRVADVPFHLAQETADLLARETGRPGPVAGSLFGTLAPRYDHVPTGG